MKSRFNEDDRPVTRWIGYLLKRAQQALRTSIDAALQDLDVNLGQYAVLEGLADADQAPLSNADLARRCFVKPQTANQLVATLIERGAVNRRDDAFPGRAVGLQLTPGGRRLLRRARASVSRIESKMLRDLTVGECEQLAKALTRCAEALEES